LTNERASLPPDGTRRPRRGRRLLILVLAVTVLGAVALDRTYRYAVRPERLVRLTEEHLSRFFAGKVRIGDARLSLFEGIRLFDVTIDMPPSADDGDAGKEGGAAPPMFSCRRVELQHRPFALVLGNLFIDSVTAFEPTCTVVHESESGRTNISDFLRPDLGVAVDRLERRVGRLRDDATVLPVIELRNACIRVLDRNVGGLREVENLTLSVRARPAVDHAGRYDIVWNSTGTRNGKGADGGAPEASGGYSQLDLNTGYVRNIHGGLPSMSIEAVMLVVNARYDGVGAWTNLLGLGGRVRAVDYNLIGDADKPDDRSVTIELSGAAISIPVDATEHPLPRDQRYLRFAGVNGTVVATAQALRAEFEGEFHGSPCSVRATLRSDLEQLQSLDDVEFDVELSALKLRVPRMDDDAPPEQVRFVQRFRALSNAYEDFDPHGVVDLDVHATKKAGADEPVYLRHGLITVLDGDAAFEHFPYRGHNMTGTIEFKPEGVFVRGLRGEHDGGEVTVNGWMAAPNKCAELRFDAVGRHIPIDDALLNALRPNHRRTAMRFDPQGRLDIDVALHRAACVGDEPKGQWSTTVTLNLKENQATYEDFPYPVEGLTGTIIIESDRTRVVDVRGRPMREKETSKRQNVEKSKVERSKHEAEEEVLTASKRLADSGATPRARDASISIRGDIHFDGGDVTDIGLIVSAVNIPVDDALTAALPEAMRDRLRAFHPEGSFHCETRLFPDPLYRTVRHASRVWLEGLSLRHELLPIPLHDVIGSLLIDSHRVAAEHLTGRHGESVVVVNGSIDPVDPDRYTNLAVEARRIKLNEEFRSALAEPWRERLGPWHVDGPFDLNLNVVRGTNRWNRHRDEDARSLRHDDDSPRGEGRPGEADPWNLFGTIRLEGSDIRYGTGALHVSNVRGAVSFDSTGVQGRQLTGRFGEATVQVDFDTGIQDGKHRGTLRLAATRLQLDRRLRDLLPNRMRSAWERLAPSGTIDLLVDRLEFARTEERTPIWTVEGRMGLNDVDLHGETDVAGATGFLTFGGTLSDRLGGCMVSGELKLDRVTLLERQLRRFGSDWSLVQTAAGAGQFTLSHAQAELYDGFVAGDLKVMMGPERSTYDLSTTIQNAQLDLMLGDSRRLTADLSEPVTMHGNIDAYLYLSGILGERESRRGGGRFEISAGHIYKLPLMSAILHVLNLSLPLESSLESAQASFFLVGNRVDLPSVALYGSGIELAGSGSMTLPDYALDVTLVNVNPRRWARVPVLSDILEGASRELVVLHVTGPIGRPTVRTRPLAGLGDEFKKLFQQRGSSTRHVVKPSE
jgi:hypothetical protein